MVKVEYRESESIQNEKLESGEFRFEAQHVEPAASITDIENALDYGYANGERGDYDALPINKRYKVVVYPIKNGAGYWSFLKCDIYLWTNIVEQGLEPWMKVGEYIRNFGEFFHTFFPFTKGGKEYALYSPDYTSTRVMSLPDCQDLGGEEPDDFGFCPAEFYVPSYGLSPSDFPKDSGVAGQHGFVSGCHWGDDNSLKVCYLDLKNADRGEIQRDMRFGYHELPDGVPLHDAVNMDYFWYGDYYGDGHVDRPLISIASRKHYNLSETEDDRKKLLEEWQDFLRKYVADHPDEAIEVLVKLASSLDLEEHKSYPGLNKVYKEFRLEQKKNDNS